ncbi:MAG: hypothetical protein IIB90_07250 [Gemmatimonadetes bacterium]|nr:hypothetical protein [Gemmatimonadota bacterium]
MGRPNMFGLPGLIALVVACGGGDIEPSPGAGEILGSLAEDTTQAVEAPRIELSREVFAYRGGSRDPFRSLVESGFELRPFIEDLRLTSVIYDERYPERSVAVLQDLSQARRYNVRVDDEFGRLRVAAIRKYEVVLTIEEFGVPRQVVISLRRRQEGNP